MLWTMRWQNFIRLIQINVLCLSAVSSRRTVASLKELIKVHNTEFQSHYPQQPVIPKMHYMVHLPSQLNMFGPLRQQSCMRFEAKHMVIKGRKWRNFKNIAKSVAEYHQRWMCMWQTSSGGQRSSAYLYAGDDVRSGYKVTFKDLPEHEALYLSSIIDLPLDQHIMVTQEVVIHGLHYRQESVLICHWDPYELPKTAVIKRVLVIDHRKFLSCRKLKVSCFEHYVSLLQAVKKAQSMALATDVQSSPTTPGPSLTPSQSLPPSQSPLFSSGVSSSSLPRMPTIQRTTPTTRQPIYRLQRPSVIEPEYSPFVQAHLENGTVDQFWSKFIEETAYWILAKHPNERNYQDFGQAMCHKYPCVAETGKTEWAHFCGKLSQKIRNIRWRNKIRSEGSTRQRSKFRKFAEAPEAPEIDAEAAQKAMKEILEADHVDHPKLVRLQHDTFRSHRQFMGKLPSCDVHNIVDAFPILKDKRYIEREFHILLKGKDMARMIDNLDEVLTKADTLLDGNGKTSENTSDSDEEGKYDKYELCQQIGHKICMQVPNENKPLIVNKSRLELDMNKLSARKDPPRLIISSQNSGFICADGVVVLCNGTIKELLIKLMMAYYVWDLEYLRQYQLLGLLQKYLLEEDTKFQRSTRYIKFVKKLKMKRKPVDSNTTANQEEELHLVL